MKGMISNNMRNILEYPVNYKEAMDYLDGLMASFLKSLESPSRPIGSMDGEIIEFIKDKLDRAEKTEKLIGEFYGEE